MMEFTLSNYATNLDTEAKRRYLEKLSGFSKGGYNFPDPYSVGKHRFCEEISLWPPILFGDVYIYLKTCDNEDFNDSTLKNYKSLSAYEYVVAGKVQNIRILKEGDSDFVLVTAEVERSMKISLRKHKPWVIVQKNGSVKTAHCTCMAGLGEACSHIAALLFQMEKALKLQLNTLTPTDVPSKWQRPTAKQVESSTVTNLELKKTNWMNPNKRRKFNCIKIPELPGMTDAELLMLKELCPDAVCVRYLNSPTTSDDDESTDSVDSTDEDIVPTVISVVNDVDKKAITEQ